MDVMKFFFRVKRELLSFRLSI